MLSVTTLIGASACECTCSLSAQQFLLLHWFIILISHQIQNHYDFLQLKTCFTRYEICECENRIIGRNLNKVYSCINV